MDFHLTEEQKLFKETVRRLAQKHLAPAAVARAHSDDFPWDVAKLLAENGLFGITIAEADGGQGGSLMDAVIAIEEVALACPRSADVIQAGNFGAIRTLAEYASPDQKKRFLPDLLTGKKVIAVAMTEPEAGSAVTELKTSATADGKGFRLNGSKVFTTLSTEAEVFLVYVRFGPGTGGIGSIILERGTPGFSLGQKTRFMGGDFWQQLYFENCYVPTENVLLAAGGFKKQIAGFNAERIGNTSRALAVGRHAYNVAREYARVRRQFGQMLSEFQGIQWKFADMAIKLESAQLLLYRAAVNAANALPSEYETAIAKVACNRTGFEVANEALQITGALGFTEESIVQYCVRRTRGWMIAGGSVEIMLNRIAGSIFGKDSRKKATILASNDPVVEQAR
jgi:alkylation response protein AidB-like acyl-CoA dehydrogenase